MVTATFTGNSIVVTFEENPENQAESHYDIEYQCANKVVPHTIDQTKNIGINPSNGMRIYSDTLLYEEHVSAGLTRTPTIKLYTIDANQKRSGAYTIEASNPPPAAPSFQSEVSHNLIIMNFYPGTDSDFVGYHVWASETSPVAKITENEKAFGPNPIVSFAAEPSTTYYVRYSGYDAFGDDGALEIEVEITTPTDPALDAFSELNEELTEAQGQLADLIATYGDTASASASAEAAQEALDDALAAALLADGHATVASTKRDEAEGFASSASADAVSAGEGASVATSKAAAASLSESSAATNATLTASFASGVATSLSDVFPKTLNPDLFSWNASSGTTASWPPITENSPTWVAPDRTYIEVPTGYYQLAFRGVVPVTNGDVFRLTADVEQTQSAGALSSAHWYVRILDANFNLLASLTAVGGYQNLAQGTRGVMSYKIGYNAPGLCDYNVTTGGAKYLRFTLLVNRMESAVATQPGSVARVHSMYLEDIKSEANATNQAGISTTQATTATDAAASATTQSNLAATYSAAAKNEVIKQLPSTFEDDGTYFRNGYDGSPAASPPFSIGSLGGSFKTISGVGRVIEVTSASATRDVSTIGVLPVIPGRQYRITCRCRTLANTRSISLYFIGLDDNYAYGGARTGSYVFTATTTWQTFTYDVDPTAFIPNGLAYVRPLWRGNAGAETLQLHSLKIEDITEAMDAAASATISSNQAAVATAQAAAAQQSMALTASLMGNYLTQNGGFDNYPSNATGALPYAWTGTGTHLSYRVADPQGGWAWRGISTAGSDCYINTATQHVVKQNDYVVYEGEIILNSGALTGSGMLVYGLNSSGAVLESNYIQFAVEKDSTNTVVGAGVAGRSYKFSKMFRLANANTVGIQIYAMNHWTSLGSVAAANDITWRRCGVRVANAQEIAAGVALPALEATVTSQASVLATHETKLASHLTRVSAGSGTAELKLTALDSGGNAASQIALTADQIKMGNTGGGLTINGGKATFTGELNVGNDTGQRVKITSNLIEVYNSSGVRLIRLGIW